MLYTVTCVVCSFWFLYIVLKSTTGIQMVNTHYIAREDNVKRLVLVLSVLALVSVFGVGPVFSAEENLAKGCRVSFSKPANYGAG
jgi:uncharacterized membrane protein YbjE (DUF340 family)